MSAPAIHIFPGMGADERMYPEPWLSLPNSHFYNWSSWQGESSIKDFAKALIKTHKISSQDILIGSSLGGVIAAEIAQALQARGLVLVGSAKDPGEINTFLKALQPLIHLSPISFSQKLCSSLPGHELTNSFAQANPEFIRTMCQATFHWQGFKKDIPLLRLHGKSDLIIPYPKDADLTLNTGHLIAFTQPEACVYAIQNWLQKLSN